MKKFLLQIILLVFVPTAIIVGICEWSVRRIPNDYSYKNEWMTNNASSVQILNFGSSHGFYGIRPEYFSRPAFNLAFVSQSIKYDHFLFNKYAQLCDSLRFVILPVSYFSLRGELEGGGEDWRVRNYCIYMGCDYHKGELKYNVEILSKEKMQYVFPSWFQKESFVSCDEYGWSTGYSKINRNNAWYEAGPVAAKRHTKEDTICVSDNVLRLKAIIQDCQRRNIHVILLTTPTYHTYYDVLEEGQLRQTTATCTLLEQQYSNVTYLNWLKNQHFTEDDFFDADHLNEYGAQKLTIMLDHYIADTLSKTTTR